MKEYKEKYPNSTLKSKSAVVFLGQKRPKHSEKLRKKRIIRVCKGCEKGFEILPKDPKMYCSAPCYISNANPMNNPESREKISKANTGRKLTTLQRKRISVSTEGKPKSKAMKEKLSKTKTEQWKDPEFRNKMMKFILETGKKNRGRKGYSKGKTWEELYGEGKAKEMKEESSKLRKNMYNGEDNPFFGKHHNKETKEYIRLLQKKLYANPEYKQKMLKKIFKGLKLRPTSLEKIVINIIEKYKLPYDYVGDGKVFIAGKVPDFINSKNKVLVEVCGNYWHTKEEMKERAELFSRYGFVTIVIWEHELKELPEGEIVNMLKTP